MRIGILGAGNVGGTLGRRWASKGHEVRFGARRPDAGEVALARAAAESDLVVLAVPWVAAREAIEAAGDLTGKILIDATNPLGPDGLTKGLVIGHTSSAAEQVAAWARGARVVKAFNTTGWQNMADPGYGASAAAMFVCGDDGAANGAVVALAAELGFEALDAGPLRVARLLEPLAMLWIHLAVFRGLGTSFAFGLLRR